MGVGEWSGGVGMRVCVGVCGRWLVGLLVVCGCWLGWGGQAWAGVGFSFSSSFGPPAPGGFVAPVGLGVDNSAGASRGDVYVADQGGDVLYKFAAGGVLLGKGDVAGAAVDGVAADSYANANSGDVLVAGLGSGVASRLTSDLVLKEELKGLVQPTAVAFDAAGSMFVAEIGGTGGTGKVLEFNAAGEPVDAGGTPSANNTVLDEFGEPRALAVSASGEQIYLATPGGVAQYSLSEGAYGQSATFGGESTTGLSVSAKGDVYADNGSQITVYEPSGATLATFGGGALVSPAYGVGVDESSGEVYAADVGAFAVDAFQRGETPEEPEAVSTSSATGTSVRLEGVLKAGGSGTSGYYFQYAAGPSCTSGEATPAEPGTSGPVHADVSSLTPSTQYSACLVATNSFGSTTGPAGSFSTLSVAPVLEGNPETFSHVGSRNATLTAEVNTENLPGSYHFLYGPSATFTTEPQETPEVTLPASTSPVLATAQLTGLTPQTEYEFRIVVENSKGQTTQGSIESFTTLQAENPTLPDERVAEMVTPPENQNANVYVPHALNEPVSQGVETLFPFQVAGSGTAVTYVGDATTGGEGEIGKGLGDQYVARRLPSSGWQENTIQPAAHRNTNFQGFGNYLAVGVWTSGSSGEVKSPPLTDNAPAGGYATLYDRDDFGGETTVEEGLLYQPLFTNSVALNRTANLFGVSQNVNDEGRSVKVPVFAGGSAGFGSSFLASSVGGALFEANDDLTSAGSALRPGLDARVKAEIVAGEDNDYLYESVGGRSEVVDVLPDGEVAGNATFGAPSFATEPKENPPDFGGVVSGGGGWVYWTDEGSDPDSGVVFVRVGGSRTVQVSAGPARYWTSADGGRYAFYVESGALFRFDALSETREALTDVGAGVQGVIGASEDGESVYAVTSGVLPGSGPNGEGAMPVEEPGVLDNLYLLPHGGAPVFIATLAETDGKEAQPMISQFGSSSGIEFGDWQPGLGHRTAGVTGGGGGVVFMSGRRLPVVGFPDGYPGSETDEVYLFQAGVDRLFCVSCSSSGEPVQGGAAAVLPVSWRDVHLPEWVADEGNRVFFDSEVPLVSQDTNGRQDVYEWEREGTGGCRVGGGVNGGCVYLLSGGTSEADSWFIGASESGDDVFIATRAQLSPLDRNDTFDLYDERVGGAQPVTAPLCTGTGCQGLPAPPPVFATPASETFSGVGNFPPPTPAKPKAKAKKKALTRSQKRAGALKSRRECNTP